MSAQQNKSTTNATNKNYSSNEAVLNEQEQKQKQAQAQQEEDWSDDEEGEEVYEELDELGGDETSAISLNPLNHALDGCLATLKEHRLVSLSKLIGDSSEDENGIAETDEQPKRKGKRKNSSLDDEHSNDNVEVTKKTSARRRKRKKKLAETAFIATHEATFTAPNALTLMSTLFVFIVLIGIQIVSLSM